MIHKFYNINKIYNFYNFYIDNVSFFVDDNDIYNKSTDTDVNND